MLTTFIKLYDSTPDSFVNEIKSAIELGFRNILRNRVETRKESLDLEWCDRLIDIAIQAVKGDACSGNLPINLFTDLFDCKSIGDCEKLFELLEKRVDIWKEPTFYDHMKNQMLRCCNDLLRRLSKSQNAVFGGRILELIATFFPLFERSGLNLTGDFNHDNNVVLSQDEINLADEDEDDIYEMDTSEESKNEQIKIDYNLYRKFWHLQTFFKNPVNVYSKANWKQFQSYTGDVLNVFSAHKIESSNSNSFRFFDNSDMDLLEKEDVHFTRYLTSKKILDLQLGDSCFRRYILVQLLILFQYLTSPVRTRPENLVLSDEQLEWVKDTTEKVYDLIEATPPKGQEMRNCVEHILKREEFWNVWKNEMCPILKPVNEEPLEQPPPPPRKKRLGDEIKAAEDCGKEIIGNPELTKLWNLCQDNWDACLSEERVFTPALEKFFEPYMSNYIDEKPEDRQKMLLDKGDFVWRSLRLLSQKSSHFFTPSNQSQVKPIHQYLDAAIEKVMKELTAAHADASRGLHDLGIQDAEDISNDELLRQMDDSSNLGPNSEQNTSEATPVE